MRLLLLKLVLVLIILYSCDAVRAQSLKDTLRLQTIQILGRKVPNKFNETRSEIDSITLVRSSSVRLSELLSQNTPIFIKEYGRGAMATASFRGTAPSHTKVSWNGLELNSPMLGMVDFSLIPVYFADEVKVLHGSSSMTESAGALGGTIRLDNRANWGNTLSGKLLSSYGSFKTFDEYAQLSIGNRKVQSKSAFYYNSSQNDFQFVNKLNATIDPQTNQYIYPSATNKNADYLNYGFLEELYFQTGPNNSLSVRSWLQHNERSIPQLLTNESNEQANINRQNENALRSVAEWKHYGSKSRLSVLSALNLQNSSYKLKNKVSGAPDQVVIDANSKITSFVNKFSYRYQFDEKLAIEAGLHASLHHVLNENLRTTSNLSGYNKSRFENSLYARIEKQFSPNWNAVMMIREEVIDFVHKGLLPLLRINYRPDPAKSLVFSGSAAQNIHAPTLNDLYYLPGGNPLLRSEKENLLDFGVVDEFIFGNSRFHTGISVYRSNVSDWIIWLPTFQGYWEPFNIEKVISRGIEANVAWSGQFSSFRYAVKGNYAYTKSVNLSENSPAYRKQLPYIPENSANVNVNLSWSCFHIDWMWNYYSKRYTTTANSEDTISDYLYPYFMNNLLVGITIPSTKNKLTAECKVLNIFNEDYRTVLQRPMPGRNYQLVLRYDF
ncbi:MAG: TonB-dependent receptor plug domain-containing protein [Prolixibacteraceae bacterium]|nr:TonB-dependent receptor plug domain-containing protein [Prolixibacteraceae bacterium]